MSRFSTLVLLNFGMDNSFLVDEGRGGTVLCTVGCLLVSPASTQ